MSDEVAAVAQVEGRVLEIRRSFARIDMDNLVGEVADGNAEAVWWGVLAAKGEAAASRAEARIDVVKAEAGKRIREGFKRRTESFTVDVIKDAVILDPAVQAAVEEHIQAVERAGILRSAKDGAAGRARTLEKLSHLVGQELGASRPPLVPPARRAISKQPVTT